VNSADLVLDVPSIVIIFLALAMGGIMKGATGAGTPVIAIPVMAAYFDVQIAVIIMAAPNFTTNLTQLVHYRHAHLPDKFAVKFGAAGAVGAIAGTAILATAPQDALGLLVAVSVILYIVLRLARPEFRVSSGTALGLVVPMGVSGGILQGAAGISAPIAVSFANAIGLSRETFIATISAFFFAMALVQLPALYFFGLLNWNLLFLSVGAIVPQLMFMPVGNWIAKRLPPKGFDRLVLTLLTILALRLIYEVAF
jgi:uncharacterized membrane protein YfcA